MRACVRTTSEARSSALTSVNRYSSARVVGMRAPARAFHAEERSADTLQQQHVRHGALEQLRPPPPLVSTRTAPRRTWGTLRARCW